MPEEEKSSGQVTDAAKAIAAITENVPIYEDALQPAAKEISKGLTIVAKAVNAALLPVAGLVWGADQIKEFVNKKVSQKLENVPEEDIQSPKPHIGVPVVDALRYTGDEEGLADLYANLLATSMDRKTAINAHPGFVDVIKNMSPDEAKIMKFLSTNDLYPLIDIALQHNPGTVFRITHRHVSLLGIDAQCEVPSLTSSYLDNLSRLGVIEFPATGHISDNNVYKRIEEFPQIKEIIDNFNKTDSKKAKIIKQRLAVTDLGKQFIRACVVDKAIQPRD